MCVRVCIMFVCLCNRFKFVIHKMMLQVIGNFELYITDHG